LKRVIIIDDDQEILSILDHILTEKGFEVIASKCPEILKSVGESRPDLILLDIWLGDNDGSKLCQVLKSSQLTNDIPVVLISAINDLKNIAKRSGADSYIAKPFDLITVETLVEKMVL
jgi:two-component system phosphate regulon response regulator PhoB